MPAIYKKRKAKVEVKVEWGWECWRLEVRGLRPEALTSGTPPL
jgi:hypothetical protein